MPCTLRREFAYANGAARKLFRATLIVKRETSMSGEPLPVFTAAGVASTLAEIAISGVHCPKRIQSEMYTSALMPNEESPARNPHQAEFRRLIFDRQGILEHSLELSNYLDGYSNLNGLPERFDGC